MNYYGATPDEPAYAEILEVKLVTIDRQSVGGERGYDLDLVEGIDERIGPKLMDDEKLHRFLEELESEYA